MSHDTAFADFRSRSDARIASAVEAFAEQAQARGLVAYLYPQSHKKQNAIWNRKIEDGFLSLCTRDARAQGLTERELKQALTACWYVVRGMLLESQDSK